MPKKAADSSESQSLGEFLASVRRARNLSLRAVEEATGDEVSNAYLSQLENDRIKKPSPNVLHALAEALQVPYENLMRKAGYITTGNGAAPAAFAEFELTPDEEEEVINFIAFLRSKKKR